MHDQISQASSTKSQNAESENYEKYLHAGIRLANAPQGEEVVITGMAGRFPNSDNVYQFRDNLLNKVDMVSDDCRRWEPINPDIPQRTGKINCIEKFDSGFFGIHSRQANSMDPACRMLLEHTFEALLDAGVNPQELRGTRTGVFVGLVFSESEKTWFFDKLESPSYAFSGCTRSMQAQRISYFLGLEGPSICIDTACSSSLYAFENAYRAIRENRCDSAFVCGTSLCMHPLLSYQFAQLGVLSKDGSCKSFDRDANGYVRSESISVIYLQKLKDARRIYAQVVHAKTNCDGYKEHGITYPSSAVQQQVMREVYQECKVDPKDVDFVEAHATGTRAGDPEEVQTIDKVFCTNRKTPLCIGSVKSNIGHTESASGVCGIVKILLSFKDNCLFPNINYNRPMEGMQALENGKMVVVTEKLPWPKHGTGLAAVSGFGFGGANGHALLKRLSKENTSILQRDDLPRLVCVSGRTEVSISCILNALKDNPLDVQLIRLLHEDFKYNIEGHSYRGYSILTKTGEITRSCQKFYGKKRTLCIVFAKPNEQPFIAEDFLTIPCFQATIKKITGILLPYGINTMGIIKQNVQKDAPKSIIGYVAVQIALIDLLKTIGITADYLVGNSIGELVSAYADGALTLEQTMLIAYHIANYLNNIGTNNTTNNTELLKNKTNLKLLQELKQVVPKPRRCSAKWKTMPINKKQCQITKHASAEYFINSLLNPVPFDRAVTVVPSESVVLEITSNIRYVEDYSKPDLATTKGNRKDIICSLLCTLGSLYKLGYNMKLEKLYPAVNWPVCSTTPLISPFIKWDHSDDWFVTRYKPYESIKYEQRTICFDIGQSEFIFMKGHVIDGYNLLPAAGFINMVWETFCMMMQLPLLNTPIKFEKLKFHRTVIIPKKESVKLTIMIQKVTGKFEVVEMDQTVASGKVAVLENFNEELFNSLLPSGMTNKLVLTKKDIYTEFRLRGYNYSQEFCGLKEFDPNTSKGMIEWSGNWTTFMDIMLQVSLIGEDTRNLYVPTAIEQLIINPASQTQYTRKSQVAVYYNKITKIIGAGFIEMKGLSLQSIPRRKVTEKPLLETHKFIPFETKLPTEQSVRINIQTISENSFGDKLRIVEVLDQATKQTIPLAPVIQQCINQLPLLQADVVILSKEDVNLDVTVKNADLSEENHTCSMVVASNVLERPQMLTNAIAAIKKNGTILTREELHFDLSTINTDAFGLSIISIHYTDTEKLILLSQTMELAISTVIDISNYSANLQWLSELKHAINENKKIILFSQNQPLNGILGFFNCLKLEPGTSNIKCYFIIDDAPKFDIKDNFYYEQLKKGLAINVFKDNKWGSYKYLLLNTENMPQAEHIFSNVMVKGDLSSLKWFQGPFTSKAVLPSEKTLVHIYYAALNFRDVMIATDRISSDTITKERLDQQNVQGLEFSGRDKDGKRVMGMVPSGALASIVAADPCFLWEVPKGWSMEDAATVPVVYATVMYGFIKVAKIKCGQSILIHAGSGGVGQAAIRVALYFKCNIFTTVGSAAKKEFIKKQFPEIPETHIGNSRNSTFEQMVLKETNGIGVNIVLNSLAEEKLQASVRCLALGGKFLEIGKFDLAKNNQLALAMLNRSQSFHGVMLDTFFAADPADKYTISDLITEGLRMGCIKPLNRRIFTKDETEQAYRYMSGGKHTGKVIIQLRREESNSNILSEAKLFSGIPRFYCKPESSYIVVGGLGGIGLELIDWLVARGTKKLIVVSRNGLTTGYQASRFLIWKSYGVLIQISKLNVTVKEECVALIDRANQIGAVKGIFNLAAVLRDNLFENQNEDNFITSFAPKAVATQHLDEISRKICPELEYFVVYSSVAAGRGNSGQSNYGMANSVMERICEKRRKEGYPATAIQWGAIDEELVPLFLSTKSSPEVWLPSLGTPCIYKSDGGVQPIHKQAKQNGRFSVAENIITATIYGSVTLVGLTADMKSTDSIAGTTHQRIESCLEVMDILLMQDEPVVGSMILAKKKDQASINENIVDTIRNVMGLRDLKTISLYSSFAELGMDSIMSVEINQILNRKYDLLLTAQDIRRMTFSRLQNIISEKSEKTKHKVQTNESTHQIQPANLMLPSIDKDEIPTTPIVHLPSAIGDRDVAPKVILLPGIEGTASIFKSLSMRIKAESVCLQLMQSEHTESLIETTAQLFLPLVEEQLPKPAPFILVAYSYGCIIALQLAALLETKGHLGTIILIDGAPALSKRLIKQEVIDLNSESSLQTVVLCSLIQHYAQPTSKMKKELMDCKTFEERVEKVLSYIPNATSESNESRKRVCRTSYTRIKAVAYYQPSFLKLKSVVRLFKPSQSTIQNFDHDYKLQELCENPVEVKTFEGNHVTILNNSHMTDYINVILSDFNKK